MNDLRKLTTIIKRAEAHNEELFSIENESMYFLIKVEDKPKGSYYVKTRDGQIILKKGTTTNEDLLYYVYVSNTSKGLKVTNFGLIPKCTITKITPCKPIDHTSKVMKVDLVTGKTSTSYILPLHKRVVSYVKSIFA